MKKYYQVFTNKSLQILGSKYFMWAVLIWFLLQTVFIALSTKQGIPPDETYHIAFIKLYAGFSLDPFLSSQEGYYSLGEVIRAPGYLYHYLLSLPLRLFNLIGISGSSQLIALRLINIAFGIGSLMLLHKLGRKLSIIPAAINLSLFMLANTLMFVFLTAAVNYDNLVVLLSMASFYLLVSLVQKFSARGLVLFLINFILAVLTKATFWPIGLMQVAVLVWVYRKQLLPILKKTLKYLFTFKAGYKRLLLLVLFILATGLFVERYGLNMLRYQQAIPKCTQVHSLEQCQQNGIFRRTEWIKSANLEPKFGLVEFAPRWTEAMKRKTYGIMGHKSTKDTTIIKYGAWATWTLMLVAGFLTFRRKGTATNALLVISMTYFGLLLIINYLTYRRTGLYGLALQGRYLFPVLPILYLLGNNYVFNFLKKTGSRVLYGIITVLIFATAGLPSYIYATNPTWHTETMKNINSSLQHYLKNIFN